MNILGINSVYHESAAAVVVDGTVVAAAEEERFNRRKHGKAADVRNPDELPIQAMRYCLRAAGLSPRSLDAVAFSFDPLLRRQTFECDPFANSNGWGTVKGEQIFQEGLARLPCTLSTVLDIDITPAFHWVRHHIAHAASAFYPSGFHDAAILVVDGIGENDTMFLGVGERDRIQPLEVRSFPDSIGFLWEKVCKYLGFSEYDSCKVMGLAAYGNATTLARQFERLAVVKRDGFDLDPTLLQFRTDRYQEIEALLGPHRSPHEKLEQRHADIAASLQVFTDQCLLTLARRLYGLVKSPRLCYSGGVALNCATNWRLKEESPFEQIFIPPAPHDAGTAIGAALAIDPRHSVPNARSPSQGVYLGPEYNPAEIVATLQTSGWTVTRSSNPIARAAAMIAEGRVIGWFQGRMEFGPRALGNRSLFADPRRAESRVRLNEMVKRRESFRPFAPSVLSEKASEWFDLGRFSASLEYMLFACPVRPEKAPLIPAVLHIDHTSRLHLVRQAENHLLHDLLCEFDRLTGVPMILNTSFNDNEPIVNSPSDALQTFQRAPLDALMIGYYVIERSVAGLTS